MEVKIRPQSPDGMHVDITGIICDTHEEVFQIIKLVEAIKEGHKIDVEECKKLFK